MPLPRRAVAAWLLGSILACSGLGLCWARFAPAEHACCEQESASSAKPCSSVGTLVATAVVLSPCEAALPVTVLMRGVASVAPEVFHTPHVKPPPLVLRI
jgi:hypothetical protein